jgi:hypothetical protein
LVAGVAACTIVTLLPLTRRQKLERAAQTQTGPVAAVSPSYDELDVASSEHVDDELDSSLAPRPSIKPARRKDRS